MPSTGPHSKQTRKSVASRAVPWLVCGAACGFAIAVFSLVLAVATGSALVVAGLARRRADAFGLIAVGFVFGFAVYLALAVLGSAINDSPSSGERGS